MIKIYNYKIYQYSEFKNIYVFIKKIYMIDKVSEKRVKFIIIFVDIDKYYGILLEFISNFEI